MPIAVPPPTRPPSATNGWLNAVAALIGVATLTAVTRQGLNPHLALVLCALAITAPIAAADILWHKVYKRPSAGLDRRAENVVPGHGARVATKLLGLWATLALIATAYWLFPIYDRPFYAPFFPLAKVAVAGLVLLSLPYFTLVDRRMSDPYDGYWQFGALFLGRRPTTPEEKSQLLAHGTGWLIKAFFLPLMTVFLYRSLGWMAAHPASEAVAPFATAVHWWINLGFFLDVLFAFVGYALTLRIFDSHIRSSNPLPLGWMVALLCYPPFWNLFQENYLSYSVAPNWSSWLSASPFFFTLWGSVLIGLVFIYTWATVTFGLRFSNLTHRGILTGGPYRFTKHPAYVAKNLYWWLVAVPFITHGGWEVAVKSCLLLLGVNGIYYLRARTEERHLAEDPIYVAYALWINEHGLFKALNAAVPALNFRHYHRQWNRAADSASERP